VSDLRWQKEKPDCLCTFIAKTGNPNDHDSYKLFHLMAKVCPEEDGWYLALCDEWGDEVDDLSELDADEYLFIKKYETKDDPYFKQESK